MSDILIVQTLDEVLPAHSQLGLVEVHRPKGGVLEVGADGEVEEVVGAVAVAPEHVVGLGPIV